MIRDDLAAPIDYLHDHVQTEVNQHLDQILSMMKARKEKKEHLSMGDYKNVNSQLRDLAAHLMQKYANHAEERPYMLNESLQQALQMPLADAAWMRTDADIKTQEKAAATYKWQHGHAPVESALVVPLKDAKKMLESTNANLPVGHNGHGSPFSPGKEKLKLPVKNALQMPLHKARIASAAVADETDSKAEAKPEPGHNGFGNPFAAPEAEAKTESKADTKPEPGHNGFGNPFAAPEALAKMLTQALILTLTGPDASSSQSSPSTATTTFTSPHIASHRPSTATTTFTSPMLLLQPVLS